MGARVRDPGDSGAKTGGVITNAAQIKDDKPLSSAGVEVYNSLRLTQ